jgi:hypothetical protein
MEVKISMSQQLAAAQQQTGVSDAYLKANESKIEDKFNVNLNNINQPNMASASTGGAAAAPGAFTGATGYDAYNSIMNQWSGKFDQVAQMGSALDQMEAEGMKLSQSPNSADQLKGAQMLKAKDQMFQALMAAIQQTGKEGSDAAQAASR